MARRRRSRVQRLLPLDQRRLGEEQERAGYGQILAHLATASGAAENGP